MILSCQCSILLIDVLSIMLYTVMTPKIRILTILKLVVSYYFGKCKRIVKKNSIGIMPLDKFLDYEAKLFSS